MQAQIKTSNPYYHPNPQIPPPPHFPTFQRHPPSILRHMFPLVTTSLTTVPLIPRSFLLVFHQTVPHITQPQPDIFQSTCCSRDAILILYSSLEEPDSIVYKNPTTSCKRGASLQGTSYLKYIIVFVSPETKRVISAKRLLPQYFKLQCQLPSRSLISLEQRQQILLPKRSRQVQRSLMLLVLYRRIEPFLHQELELRHPPSPTFIGLL